MGNSLSSKNYFDGNVLYDFIEEAHDALNDPRNPYLQGNHFMRKWAKPIVDDAWDKASKSSGMSFNVFFDEGSSQQINVDENVPMITALNALMLGVNSQTNDSHANIEGLGINGNFVETTIVSNTDIQESAIGIIAAFLSGSRDENLDSADEAITRFGNFSNSYFQGKVMMENSGVMTASTYQEAINRNSDFTKASSVIKYTGDALKDIDECDILFVSEDTVLTYGRLISMTPTTCENAIQPKYTVYEVDNPCNNKNIESGFYQVYSDKCNKIGKKSRTQKALIRPEGGVYEYLLLCNSSSSSCSSSSFSSSSNCSCNNSSSSVSSASCSCKYR